MVNLLLVMLRFIDNDGDGDDANDNDADGGDYADNDDKNKR